MMVPLNQFIDELECTIITDIDIPSTGWEYLCVELCDRKPHPEK